jgi:hypothetical protein
MKPRRARTVTLLTAALAGAVILWSGYLAREPILARWFTYRLGAGDREAQWAAARHLERLAADVAERWYMDQWFSGGWDSGDRRDAMYGLQRMGCRHLQQLTRAIPLRISSEMQAPLVPGQTFQDTVDAILHWVSKDGKLQYDAHRPAVIVTDYEFIVSHIEKVLDSVIFAREELVEFKAEIR